MIALEESDLKQNHKECSLKLKKVQIQLHSMAQRVERLFSFADLDKTKISIIRKAFFDGNYKPLNDYTSQLNQYLDQNEIAYDRFFTAYEEAEKKCKDTLQICEEMRVDILKAKQTMMAIGAGASLSVLAIGVISANLSASASMHRSTLTAIASALLPSCCALITGTLITRFLTRNIQKVQQAVESISSDLEEIHMKVSDAGTNIERVKEMLAMVSDDAANADLSSKERVDSSQFTVVFDIMLEGIKSARQEVNLPCTNSISTVES